MSIEFDADKLDWDKVDGLVPAVVQDADNGRVLMVGYMNRTALEQTRRSGLVTFYSRTKQRLWTKGETSGNVLRLRGMAADCDGDALLVQAQAEGPTCHLGTTSCFGAGAPATSGFLAELDALVAQRERDRPPGSYTTRLFGAGIRRIAQKVGEEGVETALAAVVEDETTLRGEAADLIYHLLVLLHARGLNLADVLRTLEERHRP